MVQFFGAQLPELRVARPPYGPATARRPSQNTACAGSAAPRLTVAAVTWSKLSATVPSTALRVAAVGLGCGSVVMASPCSPSAVLSGRLKRMARDVDGWRRPAGQA